MFEEDINLRSANKLAKELKELMEVCCQNFFYAQELQKRAYNKLEVSTKGKIYDVFHVSLLEQDTIRKRRINQKSLEKELKFEARDNKKYEMKVIINSAIYGQ